MGFILKYASIGAVLVLSCQTSHAEKLLAGPVEARVLRVIDGDTFLAEALVWPGHSVRVNVRIRGIDAPEMRSKCEKERKAAQHARLLLEGLIDGLPVKVHNVGGDKYYGRVLADVTNAQGSSVSEELLRADAVRPYEGKKRIPFCGY